MQKRIKNSRGFSGSPMVKTLPFNTWGVCGFNPWSGSYDPTRLVATNKTKHKGLTTNSNILAWRIPWTEELGGLQSMG